MRFAPRLSRSSSASTMEGSKKKRQETELDASGGHRCNLCKKPFKSLHARNGHMRVHKNRPRRQDEPPKQQAHEEQDEEVVSVLLKSQKGTSNKQEMKGDGSAVSSSVAKVQRKKIHMGLDLNKEAIVNKQETKGDSSAVSSSAAEVQRKKIHMGLDLNKEAPEE